MQPNKAIIGRNAFAHAAGIHQDGMLKNPLTYEIITPKTVGVPDSTLVLGKHSGRHALAQRYEKLGHEFDRRELDELYRRFVLLADKIKTVEDRRLLDLIKGRRIPATPDHTQPVALAASAAAGQSPRDPLHKLGPAALSGDPNASTPQLSPGSEHHGEQEDYLWGV